MTIKLPVAADLLETDARLAWRIVDADGVVIPWGTVVAALNATATPAPDLAKLIAAATLAAERLDEIHYFNGTPDPRYDEPAQRLRAALAAFPKDATP